MKTIKDLTPEIKAKIPAYKAKVRDRLYSGEEHETNKVIDTVHYIEKVYDISGHQKPVVVIADDPDIYKDFFRKSKLQRVEDAIRKAYEIKNNGGSDDEVHVAIEIVHAQFNQELTEDERNEIKDVTVTSDWASLCSTYSRVALTWYYFIHKELGVPTSRSKELCELYELVNKTFITRCAFYDIFTLVLKTPKYIRRNDNGFHDVEKPAIEFCTGYGMYYVNGRRLEKDLFDRVRNKEYTFDEFTREPNEDVKAACISLMQEVHGENAVATFFADHLEEIDTYVNKKDDKYLEGTTKGLNVGVYTLFRGMMNGEPFKYVRCYCPSTDRMFFLGVDPDQTNAKDAIASLYRVPRKLATNVKSIQRQGERFSTVFDDEGKSIIETMEEKDFQDVVSISGNEYFSKMRYEY